MFYRRKILLALLEAFGGSLKRTDCQKLLFLFCLRQKKSYYDFFPHKYGSFSLILHQDKSRLTSLGLLASQDNFQLSDGPSYLAQITAQDRRALEALAMEIGDLRGEGLIRKAYLEFPYYASRSNIAADVLKHDEYEQISQIRNTTQTSCLFTIGYEGLSIDAYLNMLLANNVVALVDVRKNPISMKYGFSKKKLADYTGVAGIAYFHIPDLGVPSDLRQDLSSAVAYQKLFEHYFSQILPKQERAISKLRSILCEQHRVAITCFEADHKFCHRHKVVEYLENDPSFNTPVFHLNKECAFSHNLTYNISTPLSAGLWN